MQATPFVRKEDIDRFNKLKLLDPLEYFRDLTAQRSILGARGYVFDFAGTRPSYSRGPIAPTPSSSPRPGFFG